MRRTPTIREHAIYPATNAVFWLDGSTASSDDRMSRITRPLRVRFDRPQAGDPASPPADLKILHKPGGFVFWQSGDGVVVPEPDFDETRYLLSPRPGYRLRGSVEDEEHFFLPRTFDVAVAAITEASLPRRRGIDNVVLYPTPKGTRIPAGGAVRGTLRWPAADGEAQGPRVPWALVSLTLLSDPDVVFRSVTDRHGDFILPMARLPAVQEGIPTHALRLAVAASPDADPDVLPGAPEAQVAAEIGQLVIEYPENIATPDPDPDPIPFSDQPSLDVQPGKVGLIRTVQHDHLVVQIP